jgi:hypothetical protein
MAPYAQDRGLLGTAKFHASMINSDARLANIGLSYLYDYSYIYGHLTLCCHARGKKHFDIPFFHGPRPLYLSQVDTYLTYYTYSIHT